MNQILYTGGKNKKNGISDEKKIIIFFVIFIIIFALCIIGVGANLISKVKTGDTNTINNNNNVGNTTNNNNNAGNITNTTPETPVDSNITVKFESQVGGVKMTVACDINIETISYWWDEEEPTTVEVSDKQYETVITSKQGTHTLKIEVTDEKGYTKTVSQLVIGDAGPEVSISTDRISNYVITVKDDERVDKIVIVLNEETQEVEVNAKEFEYKVAIPEGDSAINVTAYNLNGLTTTKKAKIINFGR